MKFVLILLVCFTVVQQHVSFIHGKVQLSGNLSYRKGPKRLHEKPLHLKDVATRKQLTPPPLIDDKDKVAGINAVFTQQDHSGTLKMALSSAMIGVLTTVSVIAFKNCISLIDKRFTKPFPVVTPLTSSAILALIHYMDPKVISPTVANSRSTVEISRMLLRIAAFIVSVGGGLCLGFTGPASEVGMIIALIMSSYLASELSTIQKNDLLLSGAVAGVTTNFNTPLAGSAWANDITAMNFSSSLGEEKYSANECDLLNGFLHYERN